MPRQGWLAFVVVMIASVDTPPGRSCCPAPPSGKPVVNADQTVIIVWDAAAKTQHFIRKASFKSDADDFGFIIPSPSQPELAESDNGAFSLLHKLTEPETKRVKRPAGAPGCGCATSRPFALEEQAGHAVRVVDEKLVAGFNATVLEAKSATALTGWLRDNGYAHSLEVEAWAKPYVECGWMFTALKIAKNPADREAKDVTASALRMSFKTDRPLFPYREPDSTRSVKSLAATQRLLRIYFIADARYDGELTKEQPWTGKVAWAGQINAEQRKHLLASLRLPETTGPRDWYLTEFEDNWPYKVAPADVYFSRSRLQVPVRREPIIEYVAVPRPLDAGFYVLGAALVLPLLTRVRRLWR